jgi:hypothetical protein
VLAVALWVEVMKAANEVFEFGSHRNAGPLTQETRD